LFQQQFYAQHEIISEKENLGTQKHAYVKCQVFGELSGTGQEMVLLGHIHSQ
jgi:hypothetical protein